MADDDDPGLGLDEVLAALNRDLLANRNRPGESVGLAVREVEVELSAEVTRSVDARGEVSAKWFVLSASASGGGERERTNSHRIKLTLEPRNPETLPDPIAALPEGDAIPEGDVIPE